MDSAVVDRPAVVRVGTTGSHENASDPVGALEVITPARIAGWAADRREFDRRVEVEVRLGDEVMARVTADRQRADLARAGLGDGLPGFEWRPSEPLPPGSLARIEAFARLGSDGTRCLQLSKRLLDGSFPSRVRVASPPGWVSELATLCQSIERHAKRLDAIAAGQTDAPRVAANDDAIRIQELLASMAIRLEGMDRLQLRLDEMAARVERLADSKLGERNSRHGLMWAVALTAVIAASSLGVGLVNYLG